MATERLRPWQTLLTDTAPTDPKVSSRYAVYTGGTFTEIVVDAAGNQYTSAGGGGGVAWGSITGTLTDQTDLVTALNAKADESITITAGAGLDGGGDLSTNRTIDVDFGTGAGEVCEGNDARLSDSRAPSTHATSHQHGGSDQIATATPAANAIPKADGSGKLDGWVTSGAAAGTASLRTLGTGGTDACAGNDSRLNAQTITLTGDVTGSGTGSFAATIAAKKAWRGMIHGLTLSNNTTDATNDLDIAVGQAWDNANDVLLDLTSGLTKRLDASWSVGTNQGGLDTGSKANSTWYYVWLIGTTGGTIDVLFSTSKTSPTMPGGYTLNRRIGTIRTNGSGVIRPFKQWEDNFEWSGDSLRDLTTTSPATTATLLTVTVPPISGVMWVGWIYVLTGVAAQRYVSIASGDTADWTIAAGTGRAFALTNPVFLAQAVIPADAIVNASGQIKYGASHSTDISVIIDTKGWIDTRGRS